MSYIEVDSRGCGCGKTRNTIIPRIRNNMKLGIKTLVVVPSIRLQEEYSKFFLNEEFTIINSSNGSSTFTQYQLADTPVICITHESFTLIPQYNKMNCDLIIDEALIPYKTITFNNFDSAGRAMVNFNQVIRWMDESTYEFTEKPKVKPQPYFRLEFIPSATPANTVNRAVWDKLSNKNYYIWCTWETGNNLMNLTRETTTLQFELNPELLTGWSSVWIAAAIFKKTFMYNWMESNKIKFQEIYPFEIHKARIKWHFPGKEDSKEYNDHFKWSKTYRNRHPEVERVFIDYCEANKSGNRLIYNNNNDSEVVVMKGDRITHNAHGVNEYRDRIDYAFMSAINPTHLFYNFLKFKTGASREELKFSFSGYNAYQLLMRTALRDETNPYEVNLFFLDSELVIDLMDLFDPSYYDYKFIPGIEMKLRVSKKPRVSNSVKQKAYRERKKQKKLPPDNE